MALRAFYEFETKHAGIDRIEIYDTNFSGTAFELCGYATAFDFKHDIITSESNDALLNVHANRIQVGKLDFRPHINSTEGKALLADIRDSTGGQFTIQWLKDGSLYWVGSVTTRVFQYPEKETGFFAQIRATDFDVLKGQDFALDDTRQTFIDTFSDLFNILPVSLDMVTRTSWVEENVTAAVGSTTYDFLAEIYHETKALREFARTGDETDQPITYWDALGHVGEPALFIRQMNGKIYIEQLTDLADPTDINETTYNADGTVQVATASVNRVQTGYTSSTLGEPAVKVTSQNESYPAIKRAKNKFDHRTKVQNIKFPERVETNDTDPVSVSFNQFFTSDGDQEITFSVRITAELDAFAENAIGRVEIQAGSWWWNDDSRAWQQTNMSKQYELSPYTLAGARGYVEIQTEPTPTNADGTLEITLYNVFDDNGSANKTIFTEFQFDIINPIAIENTTSIDYELTQTSFDTPEIFSLDNTWFGDGPIGYSPAALRYSSSDADTTSDSWQRRGSTAYRNYHHNLLKEVLDIQRVNTRKLEADIWGDYDPTQVLDYNGDYWFYAGGTYQGTTGKWKVTLMKLSINEDATDDFEDIPKFTDETGSGSGSTGGTGGGGGGLDQGTADARYFKQASNLSEGDPDTILSNINGLKNDFSNVSDWTTPDNRYFQISNNLSEGTIATMQQNLGLTDGSADLAFNSLGLSGDLDFDINGNRVIKYPRELWLRNSAWDAGDYFNWRVAGTASGASIVARFHDDSAGTDTTRFRLSHDGFVGINGQQLFTVGSEQLLSTDADVEFNQGFFNGILVGEGDNNDGTTLARFRRGASNASRIEIEHNTIQRYNNAGGADSLFLQRYGGNIGIGTTSASALLDVAGTTNIQDTLTGVDVDLSSTLNVAGITTFENSVAWTTPTFNTGFLGNGSRTYEQASEWHFETDVGFFRSALFANEFIINQILATQGSRIAGPGRGKIETVVDSTSGSEVVEVSDPEGNQYAAFAENDLILCLQVRNDLDVNVINVLEDSSGAIVKRYVRRVTDVNGNQVTLTTPSDAPSDAAGPAQGDVIVAFGNTTDVNRQNLLYETVIEPNSPYTVLKEGIDSWTAYKAAGNIRMKYGNLNQSYRYTSDTFGLAVGPPSGDHATFDPTNGVRFIDGNGAVGAQFNSSLFRVGDSASHIDFDSSTGNLDAVLDTLDITIDSNNSIVADGTGIDINAESFVLSTTGLSIDSTVPRMDVGSSHYLNGNADTVGFSNGIFTARPTEIEFASFTVDAKRLFNTNVFIGEDIQDVRSDGRLLMGLRQIGADTPHPEILMEQTVSADYLRMWTRGASDWGLIGASGGDIIFRFGDTNEIAGWAFDATQLESTNLSGGGDGSFTTDGILINSGGYISATNFYIDSAGAGALGDLSIAGELEMQAGSSIALPQASNGTRGRFNSLGLTLPAVSDQSINFAYSATTGINDASVYADGLEFHIKGFQDDAKGFYKPIYFHGLPIYESSSNSGGSGGPQTLPVSEAVTYMVPTGNIEIDEIELQGGDLSPVKNMVIYVVNQGTHTITYVSGSGAGQIIQRQGGGAMTQVGNSFTAFIYTGFGWMKLMDAGD